MKLDALAGNEALKARLDGQSRGRGLSHAYLLTGPRGIGKGTLAGLLAAAMVCRGSGERPCWNCPACRKAAAGIHPDIITVEPEPGRELTVGLVRAMRADAGVMPNEADRKVYVVRQAHTMNPSAQNAMLKLLEEGPGYAAFLLLAESGEALLPTVRSRCQELALSPVEGAAGLAWLAREYPQAGEERRRAALAESGGVLGRARQLLDGADEDAEQVRRTASALLDTLDRGDELGRMELAVSLEKWDRDRLAALLDELRAQLTARLARGDGDRASLARLAAAERLAARLRQACQFNAAPGHLSGWLAAGLSGAP